MHMSTPANILIVDDELLVAEDIKTCLTRCGYTVSGIACQEDEAVTMTAAMHPDLVLMDIRLRDKGDGVSAAQTIRARSGTPVVFLTAYSDDETLNRASAVEPHGYLVKPFRDEELHVVVEMALHRHHHELLLKRKPSLCEQVVHAAVDAIVVMDNASRILDLNPAAAMMFQCVASEAVGRFFPSCFAPDLSENQAYVRVFQALASPAGALIGQRIDMTGVRFNGTTFPAELTMLKVEQDKVTVFVAFVRDITERKRTEEELHKFVNNLVRSSPVKKPFPDLVPICAACTKARNERGEWMRIEAYLRDHLDIMFTHGYCRECAEHLLSSAPHNKRPLA